MLRKFIFFTGFVLPLLFSTFVYCDTLRIYDNLLPCYRSNRTEPWIGNSLQTLIEIIRKIENAYPTSLDIRTLSASITHRLRIDGIERALGTAESEYVIPYRPNGRMVPKFQLLLQLISDVPATLNFDDILTTAELCHLHRLISSTIEPYIRGDETLMCLPEDERSKDKSTDWIPRQKVHVIKNERVYVPSANISRCPIESGVIRTYDYGTLSPGIVIASIAAGLQPQVVPIKELVPFIEINKDKYENVETMERRDTDKEIRKLLKSLNTIDNIYAASIVGDLAEVCIYQVPYYKRNVSIGTKGFWNDMDYPTIRYISERNDLNWAITDSEIIGGIDGLHLASNIRSWINRIHRMRLSQVLEMYYSPKGIPTYAIENSNQNLEDDNTDNHENKQHSQRSIDDGRMAKYQIYNSLHEINSLPRGVYESAFDSVRYIDMACERKSILKQIPKAKLQEQTYFFAQILQYSTPGVVIEDSLIKEACDGTVDKFLQYSSKLIEQLPDCKNITSNYKRPAVDLIIIIDGSRTKLENLKLISYLSEIVDISIYGSRLSVIHGTSGQYLVKQTHSVAEAFETLRQYNGNYPTTLSLADSMATIIYNYEAQSQTESKKIVGLAPVVLVISQNQQVRQGDFDNTKLLLEGSFQQFRDMQFLFLTNDGKAFEDLTEVAKRMNFNDEKKYTIIETKHLEPKYFVKDILRALVSIPKTFTFPECNNSTRNPNVQENYDQRDLGISHEVEDYLSPNVPAFYKIGAHQLIRLRNIEIEFVNVGYGDFTVCKTRQSTTLQCQSSAGKDSIVFNFTELCNQDQPESCSSLVFRIEMDTSRMRCVESDCRYPDQVRFIIRPTNLECKNAAMSILPQNVLLFVSIYVCLFKFLLYF